MANVSDALMELAEKQAALRVRSLCLDFPLRPDYLVQLVLPRDMTVKETARLCEFIRTLALPDNGGR